jgi:hypothetical protein
MSDVQNKDFNRGIELRFDHDVDLKACRSNFSSYAFLGFSLT